MREAPDRRWRNVSMAGMALVAAALCATPVAGREARALNLDTLNALADESAEKMLASTVFQAKLQGAKKARVVIGDTRNNSDDEGSRVEDISNEIRNRIVATGTARIFAPGNLDCTKGGIASNKAVAARRQGDRGLAVATAHFQRARVVLAR